MPHIKILMLHGYTQSGPTFHAKTRALQKSLAKSLLPTSLLFSFPTAPHRLLLADQPSFSPSFSTSSSSSSTHELPPENEKEEEQEQGDNFGWWRRNNDHKGEPVYDGLRETFVALALMIRTEGPFDGVIGFSQGAALAALLISALERRIPSSDHNLPAAAVHEDLLSALFLPSAEQEQQQGPLKFGVLYSGFKAGDKRCAGFFQHDGEGRGISTPTMHVWGAVDSVVEEGRGRELFEAFEGGKLVVHPGGHFVPCQRVWVGAVGGFVRGILREAGGDRNVNRNGGKEENRRTGREEEGAEEMDVPF